MWEAGQTAHSDGQRLQELVYLDRETEEEHTLSVEGVFVQIGLVPNSAFLGELVEKPDGYTAETVWCESGNLFLAGEDPRKVPGQPSPRPDPV